MYGQGLPVDNSSYNSNNSASAQPLDMDSVDSQVCMKVMVTGFSSFYRYRIVAFICCFGLTVVVMYPTLITNIIASYVFGFIYIFKFSYWLVLLFVLEFGV